MNPLLFVQADDPTYRALEHLARRAHTDVDTAASGAMRLLITGFKSGRDAPALARDALSIFPDAGMPVQDVADVSAGPHIIEVTFITGHAAIAEHLRADRAEFAARLTEAIAFAGRCLDAAGVAAEPPAGRPYTGGVRRTAGPRGAVGLTRMPPRSPHPAGPPRRDGASPQRSGSPPARTLPGC